LRKFKDMKKLYIFILILLMTASWPKNDKEVYAFDINATQYFNLGLESSMVYKKIDYFSKALELNPRLAPAYEKRGLHYYFQEKYDKVIEDFTHYIQLVPNKADAYRMLGMAYLKIDNYEKAIANFDKAINLAPEMSAAFGYRAEALRRNYQMNEAIEDADRAIAMESDLQILSDIYRTRAKAYQELGEEISANADFKKAEDIDPRYVLYRYLAGSVNLKDMRKIGLLYMIGMAFVFIFGLKLKPPRKDE
jgi:tetratricopeptide (TPR) repeat protein